MEKTLREKIALIVFAVLVVVSGIVLISYFSTGRSWTIAATFVDDTVGEMDGYSVILFNGVLDPIDEDSENAADTNVASGDAAGVDAGADTSAVPSQGSSSADVSDGGTGAIAPEVASEDDNGVAEAYLETKDGLIKDESVLNGGDAQLPEGLSSDVANSLLDPEYSVGLRILSMYPRAINAEYDGVFVSDVSDLYARKGASVTSLNLTDIDHYSTPVVLTSGSKKIGVFSAKSYQGRTDLDKIDSYFDGEGTNVVVCVTPRLALISDFSGIDVVILTTPLEEQSAFYRERLGGDTFVVQAPERGNVGMIILSSNDIPSSRVIEVL